MSGTVPLVVTAAGLQPTPPATLLANLLAIVAATNPAYTATLPGSLIDDISGTDVGALIISDQALVDLINSITPYGANPFLLTQLGNVYGVRLGLGTNTSVYVVFSGTPGFPISPGFTVSDGTHLYVVQTGLIIPTGGVADPAFCVATLPGSWGVPANSVTQLNTSVPATITLTVTNPLAGVPASTTETEEAYRVRVLMAGLANAQGTPSLIRTLLAEVPGVQPRLISIVPQNPGWMILVGGGDPYQVADAIFRGSSDISALVGSTLGITGVTNANPGVVTTGLTHGFTTGAAATINGVAGMTALNGNTYTVTVLSQNSFSIGADTTAFGHYLSGGVITPNLRNEVVSINQFPDTYMIPFVMPLQQIVSVALTWNTTATNLISPASVASAAAPALVAYILSIYAGQPINQFDLVATFQAAVSSFIPIVQLTRMVFVVTIDGVPVAPQTGTGIIQGDPQSYFYTNTALISIVRG